MAITICPECKKEISTKADHCVHCGCNFIVCPECETVYVEKVNACRECGFVLKDFENKEKEKDDVNRTNEKTLMAVSKEWESQGNLKFFKKLLFGMILFFAPVVMIIVAIVNLAVWSGKDGIMMVAEYKNTFSNTTVCFVLFGVFIVLTSVYENLRWIILQNNFKNWVSFQKIDLKQLIEDSFNFDKKNMAVYEFAELIGDIKFAIGTSVYSEDIILKSKQRTQSIISIVFSSVFAVLMTWFFISNVEVYMVAELLKSDLLGTGGFKFSMLENWWLAICAAIVYVSGSIYDKITGKQDKIIQSTWVEKNLPQYVGLYNKYIKSEDSDLLKDIDNAEK